MCASGITNTQTTVSLLVVFVSGSLQANALSLVFHFNL